MKINIQFGRQSDRVQEGDDVGSVLHVVEASEGHLVSGDVLAGVHQVHKDVLIRPDDS